MEDIIPKSKATEGKIQDTSPKSYKPRLTTFNDVISEICSIQWSLYFHQHGATWPPFSSGRSHVAAQHGSSLGRFGGAVPQPPLQGQKAVEPLPLHTRGTGLAVFGKNWTQKDDPKRRLKKESNQKLGFKIWKTDRNESTTWTSTLGIKIHTSDIFEC